MELYNKQELAEQSELLQETERNSLHRITLGQDTLLLLSLHSQPDTPIHLLFEENEPDKVQLFENLKNVANTCLDMGQSEPQEEEIDYQFIIKEEPPLTAVDLSQSTEKERAIFHLQVTAALIQINAWLNGLESRLGAIHYEDLCISQETGNILLQSLVYDPENKVLYYTPPLDQALASESALLCSQLWNRLSNRDPLETVNIDQPPQILSEDGREMLEKLILGESLDPELIYSQLRNEIERLSSVGEKKKSGLKEKLSGNKEKEARPKKRKKNLPPLPVLLAAGVLIAFMLLRMVSCQAKDKPDDSSLPPVETEQSSLPDSAASGDFNDSELSELEERQEEEDAAKEKELEEEREQEEQEAKEKEETEQKEKEEAEKARQEAQEADNEREKERERSYNDRIKGLEEREQELNRREQALKEKQNQLSQAQANAQSQQQQAALNRQNNPAPTAKENPAKKSGIKISSTESFNVTPGTVSLSINGKQKLQPNKTCIWLVDDTSIATVKEGTVVGLKQGTTVIKAQTLQGETYTISVTVK